MRVTKMKILKATSKRQARDNQKTNGQQNQRRLKKMLNPIQRGVEMSFTILSFLSYRPTVRKWLESSMIIGASAISLEVR